MRKSPSDPTEIDPHVITEYPSMPHVVGQICKNGHVLETAGMIPVKHDICPICGEIGYIGEIPDPDAPRGYVAIEFLPIVMDRIFAI